ncbi:hypothetical protein JCM16138_11170 [Thermococcus atlanticus]
MITKRQVPGFGYIGGNKHPIEKVYEVWPYILEGLNVNAVPHLVGKARIRGDIIEGIELGVTLHSRERKLIFSDGGFVYFVIPVIPGEGVDGAYLRLMKALGVL